MKMRCSLFSISTILCLCLSASATHAQDQCDAEHMAACDQAITAAGSDTDALRRAYVSRARAYSDSILDAPKKGADQNNPDQPALDDLTKAMNLAQADGDRAAILLDRAWVHIDMKDFQKAQDELEKILAINLTAGNGPGRAALDYTAGVIALGREDYKQAKTALTAYLDEAGSPETLDGNDRQRLLRAYLLRGLAALRMKEWDAAAADMSSYADFRIKLGYYEAPVAEYAVRGTAFYEQAKAAARAPGYDVKAVTLDFIGAEINFAKIIGRDAAAADANQLIALEKAQAAGLIIDSSPTNDPLQSKRQNFEETYKAALNAAPDPKDSRNIEARKIKALVDSKSGKLSALVEEEPVFPEIALADTVPHKDIKTESGLQTPWPKSGKLSIETLMPHPGAPMGSILDKLDGQSMPRLGTSPSAPTK